MATGIMDKRKRQNPRTFSDRELKKVGVKIMDMSAGILTCERCGYAWIVNAGGRRAPNGYWKCPNECNWTE